MIQDQAPIAWIMPQRIDVIIVTNLEHGTALAGQLEFVGIVSVPSHKDRFDFMSVALNWEAFGFDEGHLFLAGCYRMEGQLGQTSDVMILLLVVGTSLLVAQVSVEVGGIHSANAGLFGVAMFSICVKAWS